MIKSEGKILIIGTEKIEMEHTIRKIVEFPEKIVVLMYDETVIPNNVMAFDYSGDKIWKINDILSIKRPTGNVDIERTQEGHLNVFSSLGIVFCIDVEKKELLGKNYLR